MLALTMLPRRTESNKSANDGPKLTRAELELRKCLSPDTSEILLKGYSCAWQKEILVQGHLYITAHHFCFYSSILGWETKTVIKISNVTCIKKDKTAHLFPNAIVISTADKKYGFSTFAHRNRSFNILELIWQNAISEQPLSQEQLSAKVKSLKKNKSKSVENSPVTTPKHSRHQIWQLSLRGNSKTESDSSGTDSLILLPGSNTPTPSPPSTVTTLPPSGGGEAIVVPRVTVTNSENSIGALKSNHTHQTQSGSFTNSLSITTDHRCESSSDSLFADAVDGEVELSNLNSDSVVTSDLDAMARLSSSNSTDTESNVDLYSDEKRAAKPRSPSVIGLVSEPSREESENEDGITFKTRGGEAGADSGNGDFLRGSELAGGKSSALNQVLGIHPTRIGIWRLQRALQDWCTPSNFINLLIVISIFLLLISTASMVCKLSYVNPTFQPLLAWQPWCRLCSEGRSSKTAANGITAADGDYSNLGSRASGGRGHLWTVDFFEELVKKHANDPDAHDDV